MRSRCMSLLPRTTLHSDSEQVYLYRVLGLPDNSRAVYGYRTLAGLYMGTSHLQTVYGITGTSRPKYGLLVTIRAMLGLLATTRTVYGYIYGLLALTRAEYGQLAIIRSAYGLLVTTRPEYGLLGRSVHGLSPPPGLYMATGTKRTVCGLRDTSKAVYGL